jgi:hypothetical protein
MGLYDSWQQLNQNLQKDQDDRDIKYQQSLQPGDETKPADTWQNNIQNTIGLPDSWQQTVAQQKYNAVQPKPVEAVVSPSISGPEQEGANLAAQGAQKLAPELEALANQVRGNPNMPLQVSGAMDMGRFQKLRDLLGHTGPVIVKGAK